MHTVGHHVMYAGGALVARERGDDWLWMEDVVDYVSRETGSTVTRSTLNGYLVRRMPRANPFPEPDERVPDGRWVRPRWRRSTVRSWLLERPGAGSRTDLYTE
jgi:hypothetical protein